jgi:hypothetical protein
MPKPKLFRERGAWSCWGGIFSRSAATPLAAYLLWRDTYEKARGQFG